MKKITFVSAILLVTVVLSIISCKKEKEAKQNPAQNEPYLDYSYNYEANNASLYGVTNAGARLGRVLFYDTKLSKNNKISCASCHKQSLAFSDNRAFSDGFNGGKTARNSMPIINAIESKGFFWDHRTKNLKDMVLQPIRHEVEMGLEDPAFMVEKLKSTSYYPKLFSEAYGTPEITREAVGDAMAQFISSIISRDSKADKANVLSPSGGWGPNNVLTPEENAGAALFQSAGCVNCHAGINLRGWNDDGFENIGLDYVYSDKGLGALTGNPLNDGKFKIPSLRNVALTAPYMHDGRFATLEEVVEHYNSGIKYSDNLSWMLRKTDPANGQLLPEAKRLNLSALDKNNLVAFLRTLTDSKIATDPKFSDPFRH
jgi:cytochrome c peroxidase